MAENENTPPDGEGNMRVEITTLIYEIQILFEARRGGSREPQGSPGGKASRRATRHYSEACVSGWRSAGNAEQYHSENFPAAPGRLS